VFDINYHCNFEIREDKLDQADTVLLWCKTASASFPKQINLEQFRQIIVISRR
jgi:hypothetical protein